MNLQTAAILSLIAVAIDWLVGEPRRFHPLVGFGNWAKYIEGKFYANSFLRGLLAFILTVLPIILISILIQVYAVKFIGYLFEIYALYFAIGHKSLYQHAIAVISALQNNDINLAREKAGLFVSRDSSSLDPTSASCESILENGNDGVLAAFFWFMLFGASGAILYRLINTLDAMWGYRNIRYQHFGTFSARVDDFANYIPARLTALLYIILGGDFNNGLRSWKTQAPIWDSPNAGVVMASGAGALSLQMGGPACYQGQWHNRPQLGFGNKPEINDINRALKLVSKSLYFAILTCLLVGILINSG